MKRRLIILTILILSSVFLYQIGKMPILYAKPYIPQNDSIVLETLPSSRDPHMKALRERRVQLSKDPQNLTLAVHLARAYLQLGHTKADPRYDGYAQAALKPWWNMVQPPPDVLIVRATLRQRRHDFDHALQDLDRVLTVQPNNAQAWLTQAVIHQVRGNYQDARRSCLPLLRLTNTLVSTACIANVASLIGQAKESYQSLKKVIVNDISSPPQEKLWAFTILAEMASRLGKDTEAERHFQDALSVNPRDTYLLGAYSDFLLDQGRPAEVQSLLDGTFKTDGLLLRIALAEQQLDTPTFAQHVNTLKARFTENRLRGEARHLRDEARFTLYLLHQPNQALELAQENWNIQREHWDARILLEASLHSGHHSAAKPVIHSLVSNKTEDIRLKKLAGQLS